MSFSRQNVIAVAMLGTAILILGGFALFFFGRAGPIDIGELPKPGFVGSAVYGDWELICAARAEMAPPLVSFDRPDEGADAHAGAPAIVETNCSLRHEVLAGSGADNEPPRVILAVQLGLVGPRQSPALMLRLPATLTEGDMVLLRARDDFVVETVARDCSAEECVAASTLSEEEWERLVSAESLQAVFRVDGVQLVSVDIGTNGLQEAHAALSAARTAEPLLPTFPSAEP